MSDKGAVANIAVPSLEVFAPARRNATVMLVAAGDGYKRIENEKEARPAARWLAEHGITAFVLTYRLPIEGWQAGPLAPLQDAQRATRLIRAHADRYRIDPGKVGVLGFSAGGHLLGAGGGAFPLCVVRADRHRRSAIGRGGCCHADLSGHHARAAL